MQMQINGLIAEINLPDAPKGIRYIIDNQPRTVVGPVTEWHKVQSMIGAAKRNMMEDKGYQPYQIHKYLEDSGFQQQPHGLPPYHRIEVFKVDEWNECPTNWMHGSAKASSYFFKVEAGKHLWIDLNSNVHHSHHVAAVVSIQGVNPIIGPVKDYTASLKLEQYNEKCPVHHVDFKQDRLCETCNFRWPAQNYMTTTVWPNGRFWIDGWRKNENEVRGFLITEETIKGIAAQTIGEQRVYAVGIGFFLSKEAKPIHTRCFGFSSMDLDMESIEYTCSESIDPMPMVSNSNSRQYPRTKKLSYGTVLCKKAEIGGGASISQTLCYPDIHDLDFYNDEPAGLIYGNYALPEQFEQIIKKGKKKINQEGWMEGLQVGNQ